VREVPLHVSSSMNRTSPRDCLIRAFFEEGGGLCCAAVSQKVVSGLWVPSVGSFCVRGRGGQEGLCVGGGRLVHFEMMRSIIASEKYMYMYMYTYTHT
jgi:hypothetical protein